MGWHRLRRAAGWRNLIAVPSSQVELEWCRRFMWAKGRTVLSGVADWLTWAPGGMPVWIVAFDDWIGTTCQIHMASVGGIPPPRSLIRATFQHGFKTLKRTHIFGLVNSHNSRAVRLNIWLGFTEILRIPKAHEGGGDIMVLQMTPADCRWIRG